MPNYLFFFKCQNRVIHHKTIQHLVTSSLVKLSHPWAFSDRHGWISLSGPGSQLRLALVVLCTRSQLRTKRAKEQKGIRVYSKSCLILLLILNVFMSLKRATVK